MKKKKSLALGATAMSLVLLAACTAPSNKVKFSENWYLDTTYDIKTNVSETLKYSVTFKEGGTADTEYRALRYNEGVYTTTLTTEYSETLESYVYRYATELSISGEHECKSSGEIQSFTDSVTAEVVFTSAMQGLKPISSKKTLLSHTPTTTTDPKTLEECYTKWNYSIETTYDEECNGSSVQTVYYEEAEPNVRKTDFTARDDSYTTLDNEQLLFAIRGLTNYTSKKFNVYNNSWKTSQLVALTAQTESSEEFSIKLNGEDKKVTVAYTPVTLAIQEKNSGSEQSVWIAKTTEITNNAYRNVVLYFSIPLNNAYGTFEYNLVEANFI